MKYLLLIFISFFVISCAENKDNQEIPDPTTYYLTYNETSTQIEGEVTFDMGNINSNHVVTLTNFTPKAGECSISTLSGVVSPDPITFTSLTTKKLANISVEFASPCAEQTLELQAEETDVSTLNGKIVSRTKEVTYSFTLSKTTTTTVSNYTPVLKKSEITIKTNKQNETVIVSVYDDKNRPATEGTVSVIYPSSVKEGVDVGNFSPTEVEVKEGIATFNYTAPNDINTSGDASAKFKFYYDESIANSVALQVNFKPDPNQIILKDYRIVFQPEDSKYKMSLEESKSLSINIVDDNNIAINDSSISELNVSLENTFIANLIKSDGNDTEPFSFDKNNVTLTLQSKTVSGLVPIHVTAKIEDISGKVQILNDTFNIIVESGPPTAISISYAGTGQDEERAKFIEHFAVSVTDKYFNPVNTNPQVSVGVIVGYAKRVDDGLSANTKERIYVESNESVNVKLSGSTLTFSGYNLDKNSIVDNTTIDLFNDTLVTFGNAYSYPASGGWSFDDYSASTIFLKDGQYDGNIAEKLGFAIGRNHRQDACSFGDEWLGQAKLRNDVSTIDESGSAIIDLSYDYYLVGKDILVYINIIGKSNDLNRTLRIGEAKKHTLRGHGLEVNELKQIRVENGQERDLTMKAWMKDTGGMEYRNANFTFKDINIFGDCNGTGYNRMNYNATNAKITDCKDFGHSYVKYTIKADVGSSCIISVTKPTIINEF